MFHVSHEGARSDVGGPHLLEHDPEANDGKAAGGMGPVGGDPGTGGAVPEDEVEPRMGFEPTAC
jgi:hypothetical protein